MWPLSTPQNHNSNSNHQDEDAVHVGCRLCTDSADTPSVSDACSSRQRPRLMQLHRRRPSQITANPDMSADCLQLTYHSCRQRQPWPDTFMARHLHVTVSQGFGGPRSSSSFSCTCICITNYFFSLTDKGSFSLCDLTTTAALHKCADPYTHHRLACLQVDHGVPHHVVPPSQVQGVQHCYTTGSTPGV